MTNYGKGVLLGGAGALTLLGAGVARKHEKEKAQKAELASALHRSLPDTMSEERKSIVISEIMKSASIDDIIKEAAAEVMWDIVKCAGEEEEETLSNKALNFVGNHPILSTWLIASTAAKGALATGAVIALRKRKLNKNKLGGNYNGQ